jgi:aryl-alcohol dehydrogenase-like predicted oxidoreductase
MILRAQPPGWHRGHSHPHRCGGRNLQSPNHTEEVLEISINIDRHRHLMRPVGRALLPAGFMSGKFTPDDASDENMTQVYY